MKNNIMNKIIKPFAILSCLFAFASCEVGLGPKVDIVAPTVTVNNPENTGYILGTFTIDGTASDDTAVSELTIAIEPLDNPTASNSYKFKMSGKKWQVFDSSANKWNDYDATKASVTGSEKEITWSLTYTFGSSVQNGTEFMITTQVFDEAGNESKNSKDERSVTIDNVDPAVSLITPATVKNYAEIEAAYNSYSLNDNSILTNLLNGELLINGSQKEDGKLEKLIVYLDEKTTRDTTGYEQGYLVKKEVTGDNLRNWEASFKLYELPGYAHDKKILRLVTESHDQAGNVQILCHGWFIYWNDADIPWVVADFGGEGSYSNKTIVYPNCSLQGQAYDDDGLKSVTIKVYKEDNTQAESTDVINLQSENNPKYKAWTVNALGVNCNFRVESWCEDIYGNKSATETRYMQVKDINPPEITITTDTTQTMLGDVSGNVTLAGYVKDDGGISKLCLTRIEEGTAATTVVKYYNSEYSEWTKATANGQKDANNNKIWLITLTNASPDQDGKVKKTFSKTFNIFNDFGINGTTEKLTTQNFIIMAVDTGGTANIDSFTWAGDIEPPVLKIKKLYVNNEVKINFPFYNGEEDASGNPITNGPKKSKMLAPFNRTNGTITDKIKLEGTWSDNSTNRWTNKTKHSAMTVNWEGATVTVTFNANGTWTTNEITPPDATTAVISMSFTDFAGNIAKANENFFVSSNDPELLRITAAQNDGSFKAGDTIDIILEFNKAVTYSGGTTPSLKLNVPSANGSTTDKVVECSGGNGTTQHIFTYTVQAGDDVSALDVESINKNGNKWESELNGVKFEAKNVAVPSEDKNKLTGSRTLCIDTNSPTISNIKAITGAGSYKAGKEIFIQLDFSEPVDIPEAKLNNLKDYLKLNLNTGTGVTTTSAVKTGPKTVLFGYTVAEGENTPDTTSLKVNSVDYTNAGITDIAENALASGFTKELTGIKIDTGVPGKPTITGFTNGDCIYENDGVTFSIDDDSIDDDVEVIQYSINNGASWSKYTGPVTLDINKTYDVFAKVSDAAGNENISDAKPSTTNKNDPYTVTIDKGYILESVSAEVPTGTYTTGKEIPIVLNFRKNVTITSGSLTLNNGKTATYTSGSGTKKATFTYTVEEGDSSSGLDVTTINGTYKDGTHNVDNYVKTIPDGKNLADSRTIKIVTGVPYITGTPAFSTVSNVEYLTINFSSDISKDTGSITLEQTTGFKAPSVISEEVFANYLLTDSDLADYYTLGTNGSDADGNSYLTEKYVLNYNMNTDGTKDDETESTQLIAKLKNVGADKVIIPVNSSYVTVSGSQLKIKLSDSYSIPVKGASYTIKIPADLVKNKQNKSNFADSSKTVQHSGLEAPVVRVNKKRETTGATVIQPLQTGVKADCQTPGATVTCEVYRQVNTQYSVTSRTSIPTKAALNLTQLSEQTTYPFNIGDSSNTTNGYIYRINATATKGSTSVTAYEFAYRSVYAMTNVGGGDVGTTGDYAQVWVRGSDLPSGGLSLSTFPVSWNSTQFDKVRAMTNSTGNTWYWVSWEINKPAYLEPLRGDMPSNASTKGPSVWSWGMQCYIPGLANHPLYPGHSITFNGNTDYYGANTLSFYNKHCEYRDGNTVVKKKK